MRRSTLQRASTVVAFAALAVGGPGAAARGAPGPKGPPVWKELAAIDLGASVAAVAAGQDAIAVADEGGRLRLWDSRGAKEFGLEVRGPRFTQPAATLRFTPKDTFLIMTARGGGVIRYVRRGDLLVGHGIDGLTVLAAASDLQTLLFRDRARADRVTLHADPWADPQNIIRPTATIEDPGGRAVTHAALSGDGRRLALTVDGGPIRVLDCSSQKELHAITLKTEHRPTGLAISDDGARLVVVGEGGLAKVFDGRGAELTDLGAPGGPVTAVAFSPDGGRVATAAGKVVRVFDAGTGKPLGEIGAHRGAVTAIAITPDGKRLVTGAADKTVRVWSPSE